MGNSVFIIGNGFDLNLGLKTSYKDFMRSSFFRKYLHSEYELFDYLESQTDIENWIDIEKELANFSKLKKGSYSLHQDYYLLCETLKDYLSSLELSSINHESEAYKVLASANSTPKCNTP